MLLPILMIAFGSLIILFCACQEKQLSWPAYMFCAAVGVTLFSLGLVNV